MRLGLAALIVALVGGLAAAQNVDKSSSSTVVKKVVISKDGATRTYKKVIKDGKVVEETGDRGLIGELDVDDLIRRAKKSGGKSDSKSQSRSRRIVIKDGKKVIDEETGDDLDLDDLDVPDAVRDMLEKMKTGKGDLDFDVDFSRDLPADLKKMLEATKGLEIPNIEIHGWNDMPKGVRKMLKLRELRVPRIEIPNIEIPNIEIPNIEIEEVEEMRPRRHEREAIESEIKALRRRMAELRERIAILER